MIHCDNCSWLFYVLTYVSQYVVTGGKAGEGAVSVGRTAGKA